MKNLLNLKYYALLFIALLFTASAKAQIVYTDVIPDVTYSTSGSSYPLDLNGDGTVDFNLTIYQSGTTPHINRYIRILPLNSNEVVAYGLNSSYPLELNSNITITDTTSYWSNLTTQTLYAHYWTHTKGLNWFSHTIGYWTLMNTDRYLGLKLKKAGSTFYGWIRMQVNGTTSFTVKDYAYNIIPNLPILTGQMSPGTINVTGNSNLCDGDSTTLSVSLTSGNSFLWSNGATTSTITITPTISTNYTVIITDTLTGTINYGMQQVVVNSINSAVTQPNCNTLSSQAGIISSIQWMDCSTWAPLTGATNKNLIPTNPGSYAAIINLNGCVDTTTCYHASAITLTASGSTTICPHDSVTLSITNGHHFLWSTGETTASITVSPSVNSVYNVSITDTISNCTMNLSQSVIVNSVNNVVAQTNCNILVSQVGTFSSIQWMDCNTWTPIAGATYKSFVSANPGSYAAIITLNGCPDTTACYYVAAITLTASGSTSICPHDSVTLSINNGHNFIWSTGETTSSITVSPLTNTVYNVSITDTISNCTMNLSQSVIVNSVNNAVSQINCNTLLSQAGSISSIQWMDCNTWTPVAGANAKLFISNITGNYAAILNLNGCADTTICNPVAPINLTVIGDTSICSNENVTLNVTNGSQFIWSTGATTSSITVSPSSTTTYTVSVTDTVNNCNSLLSQSITVNTINNNVTQPICNTLLSQAGTISSIQWMDCNTWTPIAGATAQLFNPSNAGNYAAIINLNGCVDTTACYQTANIQLNVIGNANICPHEYTTLSITNGNLYSWSNGATTSSITVSPSSNTTYTVTVTDTLANCTSIFVQPITVKTINTFVTQPDCNTLQTQAGTAPTVQWMNCNTWTPITGATTKTFTPLSAGNYAAIISLNGCVDTTACYHASAFSITATDTVQCLGGSTTLTANNGNTYLWSNGATTASIVVSPLTSLVYTVTITDAISNCTMSYSKLISVFTFQTNIIQTGDSLLAYAPLGSTCQWIDCTTQLPISGANGYYFVPTATGLYAAIIAYNGCIDTSQCFQYVLNGINEHTTSNGLICFPNPLSQSTVISWNLIKPQNVSITIFDVDGRLVKTLANSPFSAGKHSIEWNAANVNAGIYFLKYESETTFTTQKLILKK